MPGIKVHKHMIHEVSKVWNLPLGSWIWVCWISFSSEVIPKSEWAKQSAYILRCMNGAEIRSSIKTLTIWMGGMIKNPWNLPIDRSKRMLTYIGEGCVRKWGKSTRRLSWMVSISFSQPMHALFPSIFAILPFNTLLLSFYEIPVAKKSCSKAY